MICVADKSKQERDFTLDLHSAVDIPQVDFDSTVPNLENSRHFFIRQTLAGKLSDLELTRTDSIPLPDKHPLPIIKQGDFEMTTQELGFVGSFIFRRGKLRHNQLPF